MKTLNKFLTKSFLKPFFYTFSIVLFLLVMQNFWKYLDELIGKGLESSLILELIIYASANLVPIALPLSVLLSSMMILGKLSEKNELISIKSSGISFYQIIKPLFFVTLFISVFSFLFSNHIIPYSNLKNITLMYDVIHKKLAFNLEEGVFFSDLDGYSIKIDKKIDDITFKNIIILDHNENKSINTIYIADTAIIQNNKKEDILNIKLINGANLSEHNCIDKEKKNNCLTTNKFKSYDLNFDLSSFLLNRTDGEKFNDKAKTMNISELNYLRDSLKTELEKKERKLIEIQVSNPLQKKQHISLITENEIKSQTKYLNKIKVELNKKYTEALACIIMLLIGAPIGSFIKKGGFGLPVIYSIVIFLFFYIITTTGYRLVRENILDVTTGMWLPIILFLIIGLTMIYISNKENKFK